MKFIAPIVLVGFAGMALFSFLGMGDNSHHTGAGARDCLASIIQNGACPPRSNTVESGIFHTTSFAAFALALVSFVVLSFFAAASLRFPPPRTSFIGRLRLASSRTLSPGHRRWLALLIQSPTL